ncbi:UNVERIFIED_ORG: ANTAR domain-containing protein [Bacillus sp. AZ43]
MIPGPRPSKGHDRPQGGRGADADSTGAEPAPIALTRTARGWAVQSPAGSEPADDLVEGLSLADLIAEEYGALVEPDRSARRSARGQNGPAADPVDPEVARVAELERTVAQLEHALAARVSTERAIGVLAERAGTSPRAAFEALRRDARSQGRPVAELAREVLDGLPSDTPADPEADASARKPPGRSVPTPGLRRKGAVVQSVVAPAPRTPARPPVATADGVS